MAQGIVTPPTSTFQPDSALPSVKVPEFVITGKTQVSLPKAANAFGSRDQVVRSCVMTERGAREESRSGLSSFNVLPA